MAVTLAPFVDAEFWIGVAVIAGIYGIFALGLQLNIGFTGLLNFGQAGFMAIGAYGMALLVADRGWSFWAALPVATLLAVAVGVVIGLPSLRLRADYFAITTIGFAEIVRYVAQNAEFTGANQGVVGYDATWQTISSDMLEWLEGVGLGSYTQLPLLIVVWAAFCVLAVGLALLQRTPWGRVLRAIREDEDAAQALGKNVLLYKLQSLGLAAATGAIAGYFLALNITLLYPTAFEPTFTFFAYAILVLGGLASYRGVVVGSVLLWTLLEGTRLIELPLSSPKVASLRFILVGAILIGFVYFRPQGIFGRREELLHSERG